MDRRFRERLSRGGSRLTRLVAVVLSTAITLAPAAMAEPSLTAARTTFASRLAPAFATGDFVGLSVAVVERGEIAAVYAFGSEKAGAPDRIGADTVFRIGSLSKGFAAALAGSLAYEGRLDLDGALREWAPALALPRGGATVRDALSHRVGLPPYAYDNRLEAGESLIRILDDLSDVKTVCPPSDCYAYQNIAFDAAVRAAVERAGGDRYDRLMVSRILTPLGLSKVSIGLSGLESAESWAHPHRKRAGHWRPTKLDDGYYDVPAAGGMNASAGDLARWMIALMGTRPDVLPSPLVADLLTPEVETPSQRRRMGRVRARVSSAHYGLGWRIYDYAGRRLAFHGGGVRGSRAFVAFDPERQLGVTAVWNTDARRGWGLWPTFFDAYYGLSERDWLELKDSAEG